MSTSEVKVLGTTGDVTHCDCCGRIDLKKTVVIEIDGEIFHYGSQCAAHKLRFSALEINRQARAANSQAKIEAQKLELERRARIDAHPLYLQGVAMRNQLTAEFGFWTRCPKEDPRREGFWDLFRQAEEAVL